MLHTRVRFVVAALTAWLLWGAIAPAQTPQGYRSDGVAIVAPEYDRLLTQAGEGPVQVIVGIASAPSVKHGEELAAASSARQQLLASEPSMKVDARSLAWSIPFLAATVDAATLQRLYRSPLVTSLSVNHENHIADTGSDALIGTSSVWSAGYTGSSSYAVAILDTGVEAAHPFLGGRVVGEACYSGNGTAANSVCPNGLTSQTGAGAAAPCTFAGGCEHGTHVAGIAAGNGFGPGGVGYGGVAIDAPILAVQIFGNYSSALSAYDADIISGLNWVYAQSATIKVAAVNMSLGNGSYNTTTCDTTNPAMTAAINQLRSNGVATAIASGNNGYVGAMSYPACISTSVSVGAVDDTDAVAGFTNDSTLTSLWAPGVNVNSSVPTDTYTSLSGTSMATPHVTGAFALLREQDSNASVTDLLAAMQTTGKPIADPASGGTITIPRLQLDQAMERAALTTPLPGGSTLAGSSQTFTWDVGVGATEYWLSVGTYPGLHDVFNHGFSASTLAALVNNIPTGGGRLYVGLGSKVNGQWFSKNYTFEQSGTSATAQITNLNNGDTLAGDTQEFDWNTGAGATRYAFWLGTTPGGTDLANLRFKSNTHSTTVMNIPTYGVNVYATLFTMINDVWQSTNYTFKETGSYKLASLTAPDASQPLPGDTATFTWDPGQGPTRFYLYVGSKPGDNDLYSQTFARNITSALVSGLPTDGSTVYVKLCSYINLIRKCQSSTYTAQIPAPTITLTKQGGVTAVTNISDDVDPGYFSHTYVLQATGATGYDFSCTIPDTEYLTVSGTHNEIYTFGLNPGTGTAAGASVTFTCTQSKGGMTSPQASYPVTVFLAPTTLNISINTTYDISGNALLVQGALYLATASPRGGAMTYLWSGSDISLNSSATVGSGVSFIAGPPGTGSVTLTETNGAGDSATSVTNAIIGNPCTVPSPGNNNSAGPSCAPTYRPVATP